MLNSWTWFYCCQTCWSSRLSNRRPIPTMLRTRLWQALAAFPSVSWIVKWWWKTVKSDIVKDFLRILTFCSFLIASTPKIHKLSNPARCQHCRQGLTEIATRCRQTLLSRFPRSQWIVRKSPRQTFPFLVRNSRTSRILLFA